MKRKRLIGGGVALAAVAAAAGVAATALGGSNQGGTILIGISAAKTGILAPYDLQPGQAFQMRIDEINRAGGVLGKKIRVQWIDTKSDKALAATNAQELIGKGAVAIIATCDFDYSFPAINAARARKVLGLALCASSPKVATPAIVGPYGGSFGEGSDTEGATMAEFIRKTKPAWRRAYVLKDTSLEYSKATADYFVARWKQLGGVISGQDTFVGGTASLDISSQVTRLRSKIRQTDFIFDGSWLPYGATAIRQIRDAGIRLPIGTNNSVDGTLLVQVAGKISNVYSMGTVCIPSYCSGRVTPAVKRFFDNFKKRYGVTLTNHYPTRGYDEATAVVEAIRRAGSTDGQKMADALFGKGPNGKGFVINTLSGPQRYTFKCHRPQPANHVIELYTNGKARAIALWPVQFIPTIGDGNPCAGKPASVK
jgi:branched-chain amino acid transport system substrate-binding protein